MRILIITGSYPPLPCGVGDYTALLKNGIKKIGGNVEVLYYQNWSYKNLPFIIKEIRKIRPDVIEIQYPTVHYRSYLTPQIISLLFKPNVVMIHEVVEANPLRKLALLPFFIFSSWIIFSNDYERSYVIKYFPKIGKNSSVIPIGSNIISDGKDFKKAANEIVHFGLVRPNKGLEEVITFARVLKEKNVNMFLHIIGTPHPNWENYYYKLRTETELLEIEWHVGLSGESVSKILKRASFAYQPYPDGASERRGSLLALLSHGIVVVTREGKATSEKLKKILLFSEHPWHAVELMQNIKKDRKKLNYFRKKSLEYSKNISWELIAKKHMKIFEYIKR